MIEEVQFLIEKSDWLRASIWGMIRRVGPGVFINYDQHYYQMRSDQVFK